MAPEAVLFDLDDTLIDFQYSRRQGLRAVQNLVPALFSVSLKELELAHEEQLQRHYGLTLAGSRSDEDARLERWRSIFNRYEVPTDATIIAEASAIYSTTQISSARIVPGIPELLPILRDRVKVGIISNGKSSIQRQKLERFRVELGDFDTIVISEEVGVSKPDFAIFQLALNELEVNPAQAIMVGDSWENDIAPSIRCGLTALWLNRYGHTCPQPEKVVELAKFEPVNETWKALMVDSDPVLDPTRT